MLKGMARVKLIGLCNKGRLFVAFVKFEPFKYTEISG